MKTTNAGRIVFVLLSALALCAPACGSDNDDDAPPASGGLSGNGGAPSGARAGRGGSAGRAGSPTMAAGGNRCTNVTPVNGQSCAEVDAGRYCVGANGEECICTAQAQQSGRQQGRNQQQLRSWVCYGLTDPGPQGGAGPTGGSANAGATNGSGTGGDVMTAGAPSSSGAGESGAGGPAAGGEPGAAGQPEGGTVASGGGGAGGA